MISWSFERIELLEVVLVQLDDGVGLDGLDAVVMKMP